jgi:hypothetical protein
MYFSRAASFAPLRELFLAFFLRQSTCLQPRDATGLAADPGAASGDSVKQLKISRKGAKSAEKISNSCLLARFASFAPLREIFLALLFAAPAYADTVFEHPAGAAQLERDLAPVAATLRQARTLRGAYSQSKTLHELPNPLLADGTYLFVKDTGIVWRTVRPFASELVITRNQIVSRDAGGGTLRIGADQQPGIRTVSGLFFAVFALDFATLETMFDLYSVHDGGRWRLGLKPKVAAGTIGEIVVSGARYVERVRMQDRNGDLTDVRLRASVAARAPASAQDLAAFSK